jgi:hypothetical protein
MSKSVIISLLGRANNGNELLQVLDSIVGDAVSNTDSESYGGGEPTAFELQF